MKTNNEPPQKSADVIAAQAEARNLNLRIWIVGVLSFFIIAFGIAAWFRDPQSGNALWATIAWLLTAVMLGLAGVPQKSIEAIKGFFK
jgi:hypothetical protein